jgi:hypothetical protein
MYLQFEGRSIDAEFVHLMHDLQSTEIVGHKYRGYTLLTQDGNNLRNIKVSMHLNIVISCLVTSLFVPFMISSSERKQEAGSYLQKFCFVCQPPFEYLRSKAYAINGILGAKLF